MSDIRALVSLLEELESRLDGVADEMTLWEIDTHALAVRVLAAARDLLPANPFLEGTDQ